jgi:hypothetical protein
MHSNLGALDNKFFVVRYPIALLCLDSPKMNFEGIVEKHQALVCSDLCLVLVTLSMP